MEHPQAQREIRTRFINGGTHKRELATCIALNIYNFNISIAIANAGVACGRLADL